MTNTTLAKVEAERDALADALVSAGVQPGIVQAIIKDARPHPELATLHGFRVGSRVRVTEKGFWEGLEGVVDPTARNPNGLKVDTSRFLPLRVTKPPHNPLVSYPDGGYDPTMCEAIS